MVNYEYENFESWFDELENFNFRSDRFFQYVDLFNGSATTETRNQFLTDWLRAAFDSARLTNDPS